MRIIISCLFSPVNVVYVGWNTWTLEAVLLYRWGHHGYILLEPNVLRQHIRSYMFSTTGWVRRVRCTHTQTGRALQSRSHIPVSYGWSGSRARPAPLYRHATSGPGRPPSKRTASHSHPPSLPPSHSSLFDWRLCMEKGSGSGWQLGENGERRRGGWGSCGLTRSPRVIICLPYTSLAPQTVGFAC